MLKLTAHTADEVEIVRSAWADGRLADCLGGLDFSVWLGDCWRFGSEGTEEGPEHAEPVGRHRRTTKAAPEPEAAESR